MGVKTRNLGNSEGKDIQWQAPLNADGSTIFNLEAGKGYFINTTGGEVELKLPTGSLGDRISIMDFAGNFATNCVRLNLNGQKLNGSTNPSSGAQSDNYVKLATDNTRIDLVFSDSDKGWMVIESEAKSSPTEAPFEAYIGATGGTVTESGNYKIHTFTGDGTFAVTGLGNPTGGPNDVDYVVVAGGGSGGARNPGNSNGGGGGGGFRESHSDPVSGPYTASPLKTATGITLTANTSYPITVGAGGAGRCQTSSNLLGNKGSDSVFSTITSTGGGAGGGGGNDAPLTNGQPGGSGGGAGGGIPSGITGGSGNTPPVSPSQGSNGGIGGTGGGGNGPSGGGGGATEVGQAASDASDDVSGRGGAGATTNITGSPVGYSGGGGGSSRTSPGGGQGAASPCGSGAAGGTTPSGSNAAANRGGGGGGGYSGGTPAGISGAGGKGVVIIRYQFKS